MSKYHEFLRKKARKHISTGITGDIEIHPTLFPFQADAVRWALKKGRAALFEETGLGKSIQQLEYARHVEMHTKRPVLILAPLAVARQTQAEALRHLGMEITVAASQDDVGERGVYITNYHKLHKFDASKFSGVVLDEASILKGFDRATAANLIETFQKTEYRLVCTATFAPNDIIETGAYCEFLGVMRMAEMKSMYFINDSGDTKSWRLKGHAEQEFWAWMASWAICIQSPRDLGYDATGYDLPPLRMHEVIVQSAAPEMDGLFVKEASDLSERRIARKNTIEERVTAAAALDNGVDQIAYWCNLNTESEAMTKAVPDAVQLTGSDTDERKEQIIMDFAAGKIRVLVSKVVLCGFGLNLQKCHRTAFVGLSDSYEQLYQAIRRFYRFGQQFPVDCWIVISDQEGKVLQNIIRKEKMTQDMHRQLVSHMADLTKAEISGSKETKTYYTPSIPIQIPSWLQSEAQ